MTETFSYVLKSKNKRTTWSLDFMVKKKVDEWYNSILKILSPKNYIEKTWILIRESKLLGNLLKQEIMTVAHMICMVPSVLRES